MNAQPVIKSVTVIGNEIKRIILDDGSSFVPETKEVKKESVEVPAEEKKVSKKKS